MGIYSVLGTGYVAFAFAYNPSTGITPLISNKDTETHAYWWRLNTEGVLETIGLSWPMAELQANRLLAEVERAEGFSNVTINTEGQVKDDLTQEDVEIIQL